jgi:hypothetical protein
MAAWKGVTLQIRWFFWFALAALGCLLAIGLIAALFQ